MEKVLVIQRDIATTGATQDIDALSEQAWWFRNRDEDKLYRGALEAKQRAEEARYGEGYARSLVVLAFYEMRQHRYEDAHKTALVALEAQQTDTGSSWLARLYYVLGLIHEGLGIRPKAKVYFTKQLELARRLDDKTEEASACLELARFVDDLEARTVAFEVILKMSSPLVEPDTHVLTLCRAAETHLAQAQFGRAMSYAEQAIFRGRAAQLTYAEVLALQLLAQCHEAIGDALGALGVFRDAVLKGKIQHPLSFLTLAKLHLKADDPVSAQTVLEQALTLPECDARIEAEAYRLLARCHAQRGDFGRAYSYQQEFFQRYSAPLDRQQEVQRLEVATLRRQVGDLEAEVRDLRAINLRLESLSVYDDATGLYNRRHLEHEIRRHLSYANRHTVAMSLLLLEIDAFEALCERHGRQAGQRTFRQLGQLLTDNLRTFDMVARFEGVTLAVLAPTSTLGQAVNLGKRLQKLVEEAHWGVLESAERITISLGVTMLGSEREPGDLISFTQRCLARAKVEGPNRVCWSTEEPIQQRRVSV
jgi:diguanylate cyclase (GGDEF)-like protein